MNILFKSKSNKLSYLLGNVNYKNLILNNPHYNHEMIVLQDSSIKNINFGIFIHNTNRGRAQGGLRIKNYRSMDNMIEDGLKLSKGMTYKNSLADLWWGGGKGIINYENYDNFVNNKEIIFKEYAQLLNELDGYYVTATDLGATTEDMDTLFKYSRFVNTISKNKGGSSNPSHRTAEGVFTAIQSFCDLKNKKLKDTTFAIQGLGSVGKNIYKFLKKNGVTNIKVYDCEKKNIQADDEFFLTDNIDDFLASDVDILCPCAIGSIITEDNYNNIKAKYILGGANNQLADDILAQKLHDKNIIWIPDYLVNRMGIVNCADEFFGGISEKDILKHYDEDNNNSIPYIMKCILNNSSYSNKITPLDITNNLANNKLKEFHPIFSNNSIEKGNKFIRSKANYLTKCSLTGFPINNNTIYME